MGISRRNLLAVIVTALGCSQMLGYFTGARTVSACGAGACFAPMAEVFSEVEARPARSSTSDATADEAPARVEPFAVDVTLSGIDAAGVAFERRLTPELLARVEGPHARRAFYAGALVADLRGQHAAEVERAWCVGFAEGGPLRAAFELPQGAGALTLATVSRTSAAPLSWEYAPACTR